MEEGCSIVCLAGGTWRYGSCGISFCVSRSDEESGWRSESPRRVIVRGHYMDKFLRMSRYKGFGLPWMVIYTSSFV